MVENKKDKTIEIYEYYISILELMLSDMSNISLSDIQDCLDELRVEIERVEKNEMSTNCSK